MQPFQPLGSRPPWADAAALLKRNALGVPASEAEPVAAPLDQVTLSNHSADSKNTGTESDARERERNQKVYRKPTYPAPPPPVPRSRTSGWMLSTPNTPAPSREMREEDLKSYGRGRNHGGQQEDAEEEGEEPGFCPDYVEPLLTDPPGTRGRNALVALLCRFGKGIVVLCQQRGGSVSLTEADDIGYDVELRRVSIPVSKLVSDPREVLQAFARAYDRALGDGRCASLSSLAVLSNFHQCRAQDPSLTTPDEFFAAQVAAFLSDAPVASVAMGGYVDYLITQSRQQA